MGRRRRRRFVVFNVCLIFGMIFSDFPMFSDGHMLVFWLGKDMLVFRRSLYVLWVVDPWVLDP